jgi:uncharacterized membrane protein
MVGRSRRYAFADTAQQVVGGFLLAGPFVVTEGWMLADDMTALHALVTVGIVFTIGYSALYEADDDRDPDRDVLALAVTAPRTFLDGEPPIGAAATTLKATSVGAIFSVVGAATADFPFRAASVF